MRLCVSWERAHQKLLNLTYVSDGTTTYSKAAGKFVVPLFTL
jgi:hypothetical protein